MSLDRKRLIAEAMGIFGCWLLLACLIVSAIWCYLKHIVQ